MSIVLISSFSEANQSSSYEVSTTNISEIGTSFLSNGTILDSAKFYIAKSGSPTGNCYAKLYSHTGTFNKDGIPDGAALATSDAVDVSTLQAAGASPPYAAALQTFDFTSTNRVKMVRNIPYIVTLYYNGGTAVDEIFFSIASNNTTGPGNTCLYNTISSEWQTNPGNSVCFYVYGDDTYVGPTVSNAYPIPPFKSSV